MFSSNATDVEHKEAIIEDSIAYGICHIFFFIKMIH